jgi:hypothetical protein
MFSTRHRRPEILQETPRWGAALAGGVVAAVVFVSLEALVAWLVFAQAPSTGIRLISAMLTGDGSGGASTMLSLFGLHFILAALYGVLVARVLGPLCVAQTAWWTGAVAALLVYVIHVVYALGPAFPGLSAGDRVSILSPWYSAAPW